MSYIPSSSFRNHKTVKNKLLIQNIPDRSKQPENTKNSLSSIENISQYQQIQQNSLKKQWSQQEDNLVYNLHNQYGNKWAIIAESLKQRTDNCVKNHFYSRLRKGIRKINKIVDKKFRKK